MKLIGSNNKVSEFLETCGLEFDVFFNYKIVEPLIFLVNSRAEMDLIWGKKTEEWFVGAVKNRNIYIFDENVFPNVSNHKKEDFWITLKHEYSHIYYLQMSNTNRPLWLHEGLAGHLSGKKNPCGDLTSQKLLEVFKYFTNIVSETYGIGQFWVEKLLDIYGKEKMIELIKSLSPDIDESPFAKNFEKIYGIEYGKKSFENLIAS